MPDAATAAWWDQVQAASRATDAALDVLCGALSVPRHAELPDWPRMRRWVAALDTGEVSHCRHVDLDRPTPYVGVLSRPGVLFCARGCVDLAASLHVWRCQACNTRLCTDPWRVMAAVGPVLVVAALCERCGRHAAAGGVA